MAVLAAAMGARQLLLGELEAPAAVVAMLSKLLPREVVAAVWRWWQRLAVAVLWCDQALPWWAWRLVAAALEASCC